MSQEFEQSESAEILPQNLAELSGQEAAPILERAAGRLEITQPKSEFRNGLADNLRGAAAWIEANRAKLNKASLKAISGATFVAVSLPACSSIMSGGGATPIDGGGPTSTEVSPTVIPTETASPTPESPAGSEVLFDGKAEIKEENRVEFQKYFEEKVIFALNEGGPYFQEYGINTPEDLQRVLDENGELLPASKNGNTITLVKSSHNYLFASMEKKQITMDKPLDINLDIELVTPEDIEKGNVDLLPSQSYPNRRNFDQNLTEREMAMSLSMGTRDKGDKKVITFQIVWRNGKYDLRGNNIDPNNPPMEKIVDQADDYLGGYLYISSAFPDPRLNELVQIRNKKGIWITYEGKTTTYTEGARISELALYFFYKELFSQLSENNQKVIDQLPVQILEPAK